MSDAALQSSMPPASLQQLPPAAARFCLGIQRFMEQELGLRLAGQKILVAFSGGADSSALLHCLFYLAPRAGFELVAAHLDHALRPSSAKEAGDCLALCRKLGIEAVQLRLDVKNLAHERGLGLEEAGRLARYDFFNRTAKEFSCSLVATGHTANDLAEDVLMRLARGSGWPALAGMRGRDDTRKLIRPLLLTTRADIEAFVASLGLGWIEDESNQDKRFLRNRVRSCLLPLFLEANPAFRRGGRAVASGAPG
ncbi:tRNA lysidine(34) synthetase TilS [Desulfovibrio sp. OttesenSCG-928-M16]|nr:tRNA lysidine(34) synthetase TilS [Desulfovibrio sp. OttesenSCG-928-M16]